MQRSHWKQSDIFPLIARGITTEYQQQPRFITAQEIASALVRDPDARRIIDVACSQKGSTADQIATNMVAWFSQRITVEHSEWQRAFKRTRINNQYAYKPAALADTPDESD